MKIPGGPIDGKQTHIKLVLLLFLLLVTAGIGHTPPAANAQAPDERICSGRWYVPEMRLKDHSFFEYEGYYYFVGISIPEGSWQNWGEHRFAYARTSDFCTWENLGFSLGPGAPGSADVAYIWAPHVIEVDGVFYLYYAGVNYNFAQSIMLATSTDPSHPENWQKRGVVFRPNHPGMVYPGEHAWSDARDPMVLKWGDRYLMYYTGLDTDGGIVGVAIAESPMGPWTDLGRVLLLESPAIPESPFVISYDGFYYMYFNRAHPDHTIRGEEWAWATSPFGPWTMGGDETLGWAHDFGQVGSEWYASYVIGDGNAVGVVPVKWDRQNTPARPWLHHRLFLPAAMQP